MQELEDLRSPLERAEIDLPRSTGFWLVVGGERMVIAGLVALLAA